MWHETLCAANGRASPFPATFSSAIFPFNSLYSLMVSTLPLSLSLSCIISLINFSFMWKFNEFSPYIFCISVFFSGLADTLQISEDILH